MPPIVRSGVWSGTPNVLPGTGTTFVPHADRWVTFEADVIMGNLTTLGQRMEQAIEETLTVRLGEVSRLIVETAKGKLQRKPDDVITPDGNIYGLDTGKMRNTLTAVLVEELLQYQIVGYDLLSTEAEYWQWVEFGHMLSNGVWWPGYRFLSTTVIEMMPAIRIAVRQAWHDALMMLAGDARIGEALVGELVTTL